MDEGLNIWTVYDHPVDFPNDFIARKYVVHGSRSSATEDIVVNPDLAALRQILYRRGLTRILRDLGDDPKIVECWI